MYQRGEYPPPTPSNDCVGRRRDVHVRSILAASDDEQVGPMNDGFAQHPCICGVPPDHTDAALAAPRDGGVGMVVLDGHHAEPLIVEGFGQAKARKTEPRYDHVIAQHQSKSKQLNLLACERKEGANHGVSGSDGPQKPSDLKFPWDVAIHGASEPKELRGPIEGVPEVEMAVIRLLIVEEAPGPEHHHCQAQEHDDYRSCISPYGHNPRSPCTPQAPPTGRLFERVKSRSPPRRGLDR